MVYADLTGLASTDLARAALAPVLGSKALPEPARKCAEAALRSAKELLVGASGNARIAIVRVEGDAVQDACVPVFEGAKPTPWANATAYTLPDSGELLAFQPGFVLFGSASALARATSGAGTDPGATLGTDERVTMVLRKQGVVVRGVLGLPADRFRVDVDVTLRSEEQATEIESTFASGRQTLARTLDSERGLSDGDRQLIARLVKASSVTRAGDRLHMTFELDGPPAAIANDLGGAAALAIQAVRRYLAQVKQAEAKNALGHLGRSVVMWWEREDVDKNGKLVPLRTKKLFSVAPTPKAIPKGTKYQSSPDDWKPWNELRFEMVSPQYYQYEIRAAKDGQSADIIARGDLNGDGKPSVFVLHLEVKGPRKMLVRGTEITETDPEE
jgi:hypothetical protein